MFKGESQNLTSALSLKQDQTVADLNERLRAVKVKLRNEAGALDPEKIKEALKIVEAMGGVYETKDYQQYERTIDLSDYSEPSVSTTVNCGDSFFIDSGKMEILPGMEGNDKIFEAKAVIVNKGKGHVFVNNHKNVKIGPSDGYSSAWVFGMGENKTFIQVKEGDNWKIIDQNGREYYKDTKEPFGCAVLDGKLYLFTENRGVLNEKGEEVFDPSVGVIAEIGKTQAGIQAKTMKRTQSGDQLFSIYNLDGSIVSETANSRGIKVLGLNGERYFMAYGQPTAKVKIVSPDGRVIFQSNEVDDIREIHEIGGQLYFKVLKDNTYYLINKAGNVVGPKVGLAREDDLVVLPLKNVFACKVNVRVGMKKWKVLDVNGEVIGSDEGYDNIADFKTSDVGGHIAFVAQRKVLQANGKIKDFSYFVQQGKGDRLNDQEWESITSVVNTPAGLRFVACNENFQTYLMDENHVGHSLPAQTMGKFYKFGNRQISDATWSMGSMSFIDSYGVILGNVKASELYVHDIKEYKGKLYFPAKSGGKWRVYDETGRKLPIPESTSKYVLQVVGNTLFARAQHVTKVDPLEPDNVLYDASGTAFDVSKSGYPRVLEMFSIGDDGVYCSATNGTKKRLVALDGTRYSQEFDEILSTKAMDNVHVLVRGKVGKKYIQTVVDLTQEVDE